MISDRETRKSPVSLRQCRVPTINRGSPRARCHLLGIKSGATGIDITHSQDTE